MARIHHLPRIRDAHARVLLLTQKVPRAVSIIVFDYLTPVYAHRLERPCMDHIQFLVDRSSASDSEISGHARMITCPPHTHDESNAFDVGHLPDLMDPPDLNKLLDLSNRLPLNGDGEVTPIMAWQLLFKHEYAYRLELNDLTAIRNVLLPKIRCYGYVVVAVVVVRLVLLIFSLRFGAVLEEFEVGDAIIAVLTAKSEASATPF